MIKLMKANKQNKEVHYTDARWTGMCSTEGEIQREGHSYLKHLS